MDIRTLNKLTKKYANCPDCGSDLVGTIDGVFQGTFEIFEGHLFKRACECGFAKEIDTLKEKV